MKLFSSSSYCNVILVTVVLTQVINVLSENEKYLRDRIIVNNYQLPALYQHTNDNDFGVTTIFKVKDSLIKNKYGDGFKDSKFDQTYFGMYSIEKHNIKNGSVTITNSIFRDNNFMRFDYDDVWNSQLVTITGTYCSSNQHIDVFNSGDRCLKIMDYNSTSIASSLQSEILSITWTPKSTQDYLKIVYIFKRNYYFDIIIQIFDENQVEVYSSRLNTDKAMTELNIKSQNFQKYTKYKVQFSKIRNEFGHGNYSATKFGIFEITNSLPSFPYVTDLRNNVPISKQCLNGGYKLYNESSCICPPGFKGIFCEEGCGPNSYGVDCSGFCSIFKKGCRGMYFCTNSYGCTCPVGLTGPFCDEDCLPNKYGADCNQSCPLNCFNNTCDQYTGVCTQGCLQGYTLPNCIEKYTAYLLSPPKSISTGPETINIEINFELENIKDIYEQINPKYYQLLWKASDEHKLTLSEVKLFNLSKIEDTISDLKPDTEYSIGVLLIMEDGNYDSQSIVFGEYKTICNKPNLSKSNIQVTGGFNNIYVTWDKISFSRIECNITEFVISLRTKNHKNNNFTVLYNIIPSLNNSYGIYDIISGIEYDIKVTPRTIIGDMPSFTYFVTPKFTNEDFTVKDITAKTTNQNRNMNLSWKCVNNFGLNNDIIDIPITYIVKYKINRILSCSLEEVQNDWTLIKVYNNTNYEILDVIPNAQYMIQVTIDSKDNITVHRKNSIYALTPASLPTLKPVLNVELPEYITNNSVSINWKMDHSQCSKLNGFFLSYVIEFKEENDNTTIVKATKQNFIILNELKSRTNYELKIFIKNHVGYNSKHFLLIVFKTKYDLAPVDDLIIYKKSFKNRMLGLRWSHSDIEHLNGFIISFYDDVSKNSKNDTVIPPIACSAWPESYCYTFYNLNFNNYYTIKVKAKSLEYPDGGEASSVTYNSVDGIPDSPSNFKAIEIGKTNLTLQWDIPWIFNGELKSFILNVEETSSVDIQTCCESIAPVEIPFGDEQPFYTYMLMNLRPGSTYSIGVLSKTFWYGSPSRIQVTTHI